MARRRESDLSVWRIVLGLVIEEPGHGYDIVQRMQKRFPSMEYAQSAVYKELRELEREGLVSIVGTERRTADGGVAAHPPRTSYQATSKGKARFREWLLAPPAAPMMREELHLRISLSQPRDLPRLIELVDGEEQVCLANLNELRRQRNREGPMRAQGWARRMAMAADVLEAGFWDGRIKWLGEIRTTLEQELAGIEGLLRSTP